MGDRFLYHPESQGTFPFCCLFGLVEDFSEPDFSHPQFIGQNLMNGCMSQIQFFTNHSDCQMSICTHKIADTSNIFTGCWRWKPSASRLVFNRFFSFWKCLKRNNVGFRQSTVSIGLAQFLKCFCCTVPKSEAEHCSKLMSPIFRTHYKNLSHKKNSLVTS